jgi:uncharacterized protein (TIGR03067 family)
VTVVIASFNRDQQDDELSGVWKLESTQTNGGPRRRERQLWVFDQNSLTIVTDDDDFNVKMSVDPGKSPKQIDADLPFQAQGIYRIEDDTLSISQTPANVSRPTEYTTQWGDLRTVSILRRVRATPNLSPAGLQEMLVAEFGPEPQYPPRIEFDEEAEAFVSQVMDGVFAKRGTWNTKEEEVAHHVWWLMTEVNNGGFHQYFLNSAGENAVETVEALRKIGAIETAALVETACQQFPDKRPPKDRQQRIAQLDKFTLDQLEVLADLDERFYSRREDLNLLVKKYWESE